MVEENLSRTLYQTSLTMEVPGKTLATREERHDLEIAIKDAFVEIDRQMKTHKSRQRGEHLWKRLAKRDELRQMKIDAAHAEERRDAFFSVVSPHIDRLYQLIRHVIREFEDTGDLVRGELSAEDVGDVALIRAWQEFMEGYPQQDIRTWLIEIAMDQLDTEVNRLEFDRAAVHLEQDIPETSPSEEVSTLGEEILNFYQPDEDLRVEDVLADPEARSPEEVTETRELRRLVRAALREMPSEWRRILMLRDVERRPTREVAGIVGTPEPEVERILKRARADFRKKFEQYGYGSARFAA
jgi:RNA polymerase sigma factor (sigma-70 family)